MTLYDTQTKQVYTGAYGTQGGYRGEPLRYFSIATGRELSTINPLTPQGFQSEFLTGGRPSGAQQSIVAESLRSVVSQPVGLQPVDSRQTATQAVVLANEQLVKTSDLATRSAATFSGLLFDKYESLFAANQTANLQDSLNKFHVGLETDLQHFRATYPERNEQFFPQAIAQTQEALIHRAAQSTPAPPSKLFGFLPIKVSGLVQNLANLGTIVGGAYGAEALASVGEVGAVTSPTVSVGVSGSSVTAGGFTTELGIRGAQAVGLSASGGSPGLALGVAPLESSHLVVGAAGGVVSTAPTTLAVSPTALNLGVVAPSSSGSFWDSLRDLVNNKTTQVKNVALDNPVKTALSAAGAGLTAKQIADSNNPLAALVNTVASAVGLGPIIKPDPPAGPGPGSFPPNMIPGYGGGGGGGGGSYGGSTLTETNSMVLPIMGIGAGLLFLLILARR